MFKKRKKYVILNVKGRLFMDQVKIGRFIARQRKLNGYTQEQLAQKLGITKNAVSKWERGLGLMDLSQLRPLSRLLNVSVNDILAGEKIDDKDIPKASEENIIKLTELVNLQTMKYGIIGMAIFFIILVLISTFKDISPAPLVSMICAYNSVTFLSRYKIGKDKANLITGALFLAATILNTAAFILA